MRRVARLLGIVALGLGPTIAIQALTGDPRAAAQEDLVERGRDLFVANCSTCHGPNASGTGQGPSLIGVGPAAVDFQLSTGRMPLAEPGVQPQRQAPAFTSDEIAALVAYVASLAPGEGPPIPDVTPEAGDVGLGLEVYRSNCLACHGAGAQGASVGAGWIAPSLHEATPRQIAEAARSGPGVMPVFGEETIDERAMNSLVAYLLEIRAGGEDRGGLGLGQVGPVAEGFVGVVVGLGLMLLVIRLTGTRT